MDYIIIIIAGLTLIGTVVLVYLAVKKQRYDDLWNEVCDLAYRIQIWDTTTANAKTIDSIIRFCNDQIRYGTTDKIKMQAKEFKARAERLKKWYLLL
jgi:hypothetical protein